MGDNHGKRKPQIKKQDLYMLTALWMEQSPWALKGEETKSNKVNVVGAVFVQPNDRVLSVDCSRSKNGGIVHGAIRALLQYPDQVEGCYVYLSRQPCAHCVKMLVQAAVKKVFYLPLKPELKVDNEENKSVDALFKVSPVSREVYVPSITDGTESTKGTEGDIKELESANEKNLYGTRKLSELNEIITSKLVEWNDEWKKVIVSEIGWDEYSDGEIKGQVDKDMEIFFKWFDLGIVATGEKKEMSFKECRGSANVLGVQERDVANHLSRLAQMLSNRTDDPNRGVGCVITIKEEIVATGWNGFPSKALYGNHPRLGKSKSKQPKSDKYPHVIHAEQNALMRRKRRNIEGATAYVNKIPCNECLPMLCDAGVKKLVLSKGAFKDENKPPKSEEKFYKLLTEPPEDPIIVYKQQ